MLKCDIYCYFQDMNDTFLMDVVNVLTCELCWPKRQSPSLKLRNLIVKYSMHHLKYAQHCAKNVVYASVYFCVYFAYTMNIPRVVYISNIQLVYFKNPQVTIIHCAYSRSIKNTQTTMNYANLDNLRKNRYEFRY